MFVGTEMCTCLMTGYQEFMVCENCNTSFLSVVYQFKKPSVGGKLVKCKMFTVQLFFINIRLINDK